ncbi:hypothetical protein AO287_02465 [Pseudomonas savastanoi]|uniref:Uncharacterized protein n=1 Tax=Pseudomonas savastanoi TaxID=29438 RepID=A0AAW3M225_PSESS|nr:hypothetical protein AO287_02465 [Pseudomonas savastanoi]
MGAFWLIVNTNPNKTWGSADPDKALSHAPCGHAFRDALRHITAMAHHSIQPGIQAAPTPATSAINIFQLLPLQKVARLVILPMHCSLAEGTMPSGQPFIQMPGRR